MDFNSASEHLQVIRTLMERAAVYRRALAPVMLAVGIIGVVAAVVGHQAQFDTARRFIGFWLAVAVGTITVAFLLVRRQALRESEPFWSPPTRRVALGLLPALAIGFLAGLLPLTAPNWDFLPVWALPALWMLFYGCALNAAGFFMTRGIRLFGWLFILAGCGLMITRCWAQGPLDFAAGHLLMGSTFGALHLAYGIYLYFTEPSRNAK